MHIQILKDDEVTMLTERYYHVVKLKVKINCDAEIPKVEQSYIINEEL